jgi:hypothetical protein
MMKSVKLCPKCGSSKMEPGSGIAAIYLVLPDTMKCGGCGHVGTFLEVDVDLIDRVQNEIREYKECGIENG